MNVTADFPGSTDQVEQSNEIMSYILDDLEQNESDINMFLQHANPSLASESDEQQQPDIHIDDFNDI
jgi:hypothetical protein